MANPRYLLSIFSLGFAVRAALLPLLCFWYVSASPAKSGDLLSFSSLVDKLDVNRQSVDCGYHNLSPGQAVTIQSKNYPGQPPLKHTCLWNFEGTSDDSTILITCNQIKTKRCLKVKGKGLKAKLCGNSPKVRSSNNKLTVKFKTGMKAERGFQCNVRASGTMTMITNTNTSSSTTTSTTTPTTTAGGCRCGVSNAGGRMTRGTPVAPNTYPWQAVFTTYQSPKPVCGGSIIGTTWILTSPFCILSYFGDVENSLVIIGEHDYTSYSDTTVRQELGPYYLLTHEDYDGDTLSNNIGLVRLSGEIIFPEDNTIAPICLPDATTPQYMEISATRAGWGTAEVAGCGGVVGNNTHVLSSAPANTTTSTECQGYYDEPIPDKMFCVESSDTLEDDYGGPLITNFNGGSSYYVQIGVFSHCNPGVYVDVGAYMDWINSKVTDLITCPRPK